MLCLSYHRLKWAESRKNLVLQPALFLKNLSAENTVLVSELRSIKLAQRQLAHIRASTMYRRISFNLTSNPKTGSDPGCGSNRCLKADTVSHKPTSGTWQTGLIVQVLGHVQSHSWLQRARSFTHLWPINTASVNITVRPCDLCLTLVNWGNNREAGSSYY